MRKLSFVLMAVIAISLMGCKKEITITPSSELPLTVTLHHGETYTIPATCNGSITYSSENSYVAEVNSSGVVTANYVGSTTIKLGSKDDNKEITVVVEPKSKLYPDPNISIGESKQSIFDRFGEPGVDLGIGIGYGEYSTKAPQLIVLFDDNKCVESYYVMVKEGYSREIEPFLSERYKSILGSMYINALELNKATMVVLPSLYENDSSYWQVQYTTNPSNSKNDMDKADIDALLKALETMNDL